MDIKGELRRKTAGYRKTFGDVFVIDTRGFGNQFDPLAGRESEDDLYVAAELLLYVPNEGEGKAFTQKATKMLTLLFLAAREVNRQAGKIEYRLLPFVREWQIWDSIAPPPDSTRYPRRLPGGF